MKLSQRACLCRVLILVFSLFSFACSENNSSPSPESSPETGQSEAKAEQNASASQFFFDAAPTSGSSASGTPSFQVLSINGKPVSLAEIDALIALKLFDLEWARYELRKTALQHYLDQQSKLQAINTVEVFLAPPMPPRISLTDAQRASAMRVAQKTDASPVSLSVFCNYQSSHCARMQSVYQELQANYGHLIHFEFFDFPLPFHQFAQAASHAVRCAADQGQFEAMHKAMWASQAELNQAAFARLAKQLSLDDLKFQECLDSQAHLLAIEAHRTLANSLGFNQVPVTLINGLYVNGPKPVEVFKFYIDHELKRLGYSVKEVKKATPGAHKNTAEPLHQPDHLADTAIQSDPGSNEVDRSDFPADMPAQDSLEYQARPVVEAQGEIPLSRAWLDDQLLQQAELETHFQPAEHEVEGVRLTKLTQVSQSEFYQTLGLQEGDVLMRVNDTWVHEAQNDLFDSLENGQRVSVVLVRKGLPQQLVYTIRD